MKMVSVSRHLAADVSLQRTVVPSPIPVFTEGARSSLTRTRVGIGMDAKGSHADNLSIERLWRTERYEEECPQEYQNGRESKGALADYFHAFTATSGPTQRRATTRRLQRTALVAWRTSRSV